MNPNEFPHFEIAFPKGKLSQIRSVNCGDDYETQRHVAEIQIERLRKQSGRTNRQRHRRAKEINALERTFNLGRYSPVAQVDDKRKERRFKAERGKLLWFTKKVEQAHSKKRE